MMWYVCSKFDGSTGNYRTPPDTAVRRLQHKIMAIPQRSLRAVIMMPGARCRAEENCGERTLIDVDGTTAA